MKYLIVPVMLFLGFTLSAQTPIEVYNGSFKIESVSEDTLFFAFAKGDQVIVDFESIGRELKEFEVLQWPRGSIFREDDKTKIVGKKISISNTGVYQVRLANRSGTERNCKLHIRRIPGSSSTKNFKSTVAWKTVNDTFYIPSTEKYVVKRDTSIINREAIVTVHGTQSRYGSSTQFPEFELLSNCIAWSFYIGVNKPGQQVYQEAEQKFMQATGGKSPKLSDYSPLATLALTGKSYFTLVQNEQAITYSILDETNAALAKQQQAFKSIRSKKVSSDFSKMKNPSGKCIFYLSNETDANQDVIIKVAAIVVFERMADRPIQKMKVVEKRIPTHQGQLAIGNRQ